MGFKIKGKKQKLKEVIFMRISEIIEEAVRYDPSDIHLSVGVPPIVRVNGELRRLDYPQLTEADMEEFIGEILSEHQITILKQNGEIDISITPVLMKKLRMRLNCYRQRGSYCMAFRILHQDIPSFEQLGLPQETAEKFCSLTRGLILVVGPTGTGKTTTISSMLDWINRNYSRHIITIEDPIEYFHQHHRSIIHQRETGRDTRSFQTALKSALRQDPDVLFIGEMRDLESISAALTAAETGHLVLSTLHTIGAVKTVDRIIDVFPNEQQGQIRAQLSLVLQGVISQQLILSADKKKRELAYEIMLPTPAVRNMIRENRIVQVQNSIITGSESGMITMDMSIANLINKGKISLKDGLNYSIDPENLKKLVRNGEK